MITAIRLSAAPEDETLAQAEALFELYSTLRLVTVRVIRKMCPRRKAQRMDSCTALAVSPGNQSVKIRRAS